MRRAMVADEAKLNPAELVNLPRYPILDLETAQASTLLARCRAELAENGALALTDFLLPAAVEAIQKESVPLIPHTYFRPKVHNVYLIADDSALPPDHPRNRKVTTETGTIADDLIPNDSRLRALYDWPALRRFIAAALCKDQLHPYADPLSSLNIGVTTDGQHRARHFDNADFATTLLIQSAEKGGEFEYVPRIRNSEDQGYDAVAAVLDGTGKVERLAVTPGTLVLFQGRYSLHQVDYVKGRRPRLMAILSYDEKPGIMLTEHTRRLFYGRAN